MKGCNTTDQQVKGLQLISKNAASSLIQPNAYATGEQAPYRNRKNSRNPIIKKDEITPCDGSYQYSGQMQVINNKDINPRASGCADSSITQDRPQERRATLQTLGRDDDGPHKFRRIYGQQVLNREVQIEKNRRSAIETQESNDLQ